MHLHDAIKRLIGTMWPELSRRTHMPHKGKVLAVRGEGGLAGPPGPTRYSCDIQPLRPDASIDPTRGVLRDVPIDVPWAGPMRGSFGLPKVGGIVRVAYYDGNAAYPYIDGMLGETWVLPEVLPDEWLVQQEFSEGSETLRESLRLTANYKHQAELVREGSGLLRRAFWQLEADAEALLTAEAQNDGGESHGNLALHLSSVAGAASSGGNIELKVLSSAGAASSGGNVDIEAASAGTPCSGGNYRVSLSSADSGGSTSWTCSAPNGANFIINLNGNPPNGRFEVNASGHIHLNPGLGQKVLVAGGGHRVIAENIQFQLIILGGMLAGTYTAMIIGGSTQLEVQS